MSAGAAISQAYYPDNRTAGNAAGRLALQVALDMSSNVMKEFYPDIVKHLRRKKADSH